VAIGVLAVLGACTAYYIKGFDFVILLLWLFGLLLCGSIFDAGQIVRAFPFRRSDLWITLAFLLVATPVYLWSSYDIPFGMNSDEVVLISSEQGWLKKGAIDIFGLSDYFGFMFFPFLFQGWCAQLLGGVDLYHVRLLHGVCGILIVCLAYLFFRTVGLRWLMAITASISFGANHSLVAISRMASRTNGGPFVELLALICLFAGLRSRSKLLTYLGGVLTGLCFYAYYSARITLPIWTIYLLLLFLIRRRKLNSRPLVKHAVIFVFGLVLTAAPAAVAHIRQKDAFTDCLDYQKQQCLLYPEGREFCMSWTGSKTIEEGVAKNIINGLTVFNNNISDQAFIYHNPGHGFVDPLSGVLVWLGFFTVLFYRRSRETAIFMLSGFVFVWLFFSFVTAEAPCFARLWVILPFASYLVAYGVDAASSFLQRQLKRTNGTFARTVRGVVFLAANLTIAALNFFMFYQFVKSGLVHGDDIGGTVRYIETRKKRPDYLFIMAASSDYQYFGYDNLGFRNDRVKPFLASTQINKVWGPDDFTALRLVPPFTIFMNGDLWQSKREGLVKMYPHLVVHKIFDGRGLVAIEAADHLDNSYSVHRLYGRWDDYPDKCEHEVWAGQSDQAISLCLEVLNAPLARVNGSYFRSRILLSLGTAYFKKGKYKEAEPVLLEAFRIRKQLTSERSMELAEVADVLGDLFAKEERWDEAEEWYCRSAEIKEAFKQDDLDTWIAGLAHTYRCSGQACMKQDKAEEAEKFFEKAISSCRVDKGEGVERAAIAGELASCRQVIAVSDDSIRLLNNSIAAEKIETRLADLYERLGFAYMKRGDYPRAEKAYSKAISATLANGIPKRDEKLARIYAERGFVYARSQKYAESEKDYDWALKLSSAAFARQNHYERDRTYAHDQKLLSKQ
jgi:tetratricopeptide (TPR) repeat protein